MRSVPASLAACARRQDGLVTRAQAIEHGLSLSTVYRLACSGRWPTVLPGVFDISGPDRCEPRAFADDPETVGRLARAARLKWGDDLVVSGRSAAALLGYPMPPTPPAWVTELGLPADPPAARLTVSVPPGRNVSAVGVRVLRRSLPPGDAVRMAQARVTSPTRTAADLLRTEPLLAAVAATDVAVRNSRVALRSVEADVAVDAAGHRGSAQGRTRLGLVDPACESPLETMLRLLPHLAGLPRPVSQFEVRTASGLLLGRADFAYPAAGLLLECDGRAHHQDWADGVRDRRRQNRLVVEGGLRVLRFTHDDLALRPSGVVDAVRLALGSAK